MWIWAIPICVFLIAYVIIDIGTAREAHRLRRVIIDDIEARRPDQQDDAA